MFSDDSFCWEDFISLSYSTKKAGKDALNKVCIKNRNNKNVLIKLDNLHHMYSSFPYTMVVDGTKEFSELKSRTIKYGKVTSLLLDFIRNNIQEYEIVNASKVKPGQFSVWIPIESGPAKKRYWLSKFKGVGKTKKGNRLSPTHSKSKDKLLLWVRQLYEAVPQVLYVRIKPSQKKELVEIASQMVGERGVCTEHTVNMTPLYPCRILIVEAKNQYNIDSAKYWSQQERIRIGYGPGREYKVANIVSIICIVPAGMEAECKMKS